MTREKEIGDRGEALARQFLEAKGFRFVRQNFHAQGGEIDLVMLDPVLDEYVCVEVKTRNSDTFGDGAASITPQKFEKILAAAEDFFLKEIELPDMPFFRIDAVIVRCENGRTSCEHVEDIGCEDF